MTTTQDQIGSGFGADSAADDVLHGIDLDGAFAIVTSGYSGIGLEQGAATQTWCATSPQLKGMGGVYCEDCDIAEPAMENAAVRAGVRDYAVDPEQGARLWTLSAQLTGVDAFAAAA